MDESDKVSLTITVVGAVVAGASAVVPQLSGWSAVGVAAFIAGGVYYMAHVTVPPKSPAP